jgi:5-formyltetrahydrofolate cyclo-ligase
LLLRFESNGPHRHWRVAPLLSFPDLSLTSQPSLPVEERRRLRRELRQRRQGITGVMRARKGRQLAMRVAALGLLRPGSRIGLYLATSEEIDTLPLLRLARSRGCRVALPRVVSRRQHRMRFHEYPGGMQPHQMRRGAFGILEPKGGIPRAARELDVVFLPLVGFDAHGHRIGMGRGYYDRHFAFRLHLRHCRRPLLVGLAYAVQQVGSLPHAAHDVPLDAIVTDSSSLAFERRDPRCATGC